MKNLFALLLLSAFLFTACNNEKGGEKTGVKTTTSETEMEQNAWDEMMVIHDEVMPKMSDINRISAGLQDWAVANKETMADGDLERISVSLQQLNNADDGMMNWMNKLQQLDGLRAKEDHEAIMVYLNEQTKIITKVKEQMLSSIQQGEAMLEEVTRE